MKKSLNSNNHPYCIEVRDNFATFVHGNRDEILLTDELEVLVGVDVHDILNLVSCAAWASKITIHTNRN